jgi:hypothetical protein
VLYGFLLHVWRTHFSSLSTSPRTLTSPLVIIVTSADEDLDDDDDQNNGHPDDDPASNNSSAITRKLGKRKKAGRKPRPKAYDALIDPKLPPTEIRRLRRILSNRESARRCRAKRAQQVDVLEAELNQMKQGTCMLMLSDNLRGRNRAARTYNQELIPTKWTCGGAERDEVVDRATALEAHLRHITGHNAALEAENTRLMKEMRQIRAVAAAVPLHCMEGSLGTPFTGVLL